MRLKYLLEWYLQVRFPQNLIKILYLNKQCIRDKTKVMCLLKDLLIFSPPYIKYPHEQNVVQFIFLPELYFPSCTVKSFSNLRAFFKKLILAIRC